MSNRICPACLLVTERLSAHQGSKLCRQRAEINRMKLAGKVRVFGRFAAFLARAETIPDYGVERAQTGDRGNYGGGMQTWAPQGLTAEFLHLLCTEDMVLQKQESSAANADLLVILNRWSNEPAFRDGVHALLNLGGANALPTLLGKQVAKKAPPKACRCSAADHAAAGIRKYPKQRGRAQGRGGDTTTHWRIDRITGRTGQLATEWILRCPLCKSWLDLRKDA